MVFPGIQIYMDTFLVHRMTMWVLQAHIMWLGGYKSPDSPGGYKSSDRLSPGGYESPDRHNLSPNASVVFSFLC